MITEALALPAEESLPSASGLSTGIECAAAYALPHVRTSSKYARRGTALHWYVHRLLQGIAKAEALADVPLEWRETAREIDVNLVGGDLRNPRTEEAFAYNIETGEARALGRLEHRAYPKLGPGWMYGTEDFGGIRIDDVNVTGDTKTGYLAVTPAKENTQTQFHALVRHTLSGAPEVEGRIIHKRDGQRAYRDSATFTAFDLDGFADTLRDMRGRILHARAEVAIGTVPTVSMGEHCRYCPAATSCPAQVALARVMVAPEDLDPNAVAGRIAAMNPEEIGIAWVRAKQFEKMADLVLKGLKAAAYSVDKIPVPGGKMVKLNVIPQARLSGERAIEKLRELGASEEEIASLYNHSTMERFDIVKDRELAQLPAKKGKAA